MLAISARFKTLSFLFQQKEHEDEEGEQTFSVTIFIN